MKFFLLTLVCLLLGFSVSLFKRHEKLKIKLQYKYYINTYHDTVWVYNNNNLLIGKYVSKRNELLDSVLSNYNQ